MDTDSEILYSVSDFVAVTNQTLEYAYPSVTIIGELANFRVSKNRWVYFDLKDDTASVRFFGTIYNLPGPLEEGMLLKVRGQPRLHPQFGFSVTIQSILPSGEGTIRKAADLLQQKLAAEGLFDPARKRLVPYPPNHIVLITSEQSAAYADFTKIITARWPLLSIDVIDVQVQGERAITDIVAAFEAVNSLAELPDAVVLVRGGGSADDLAAFSTEQVTRAVAGSRVPTMVAIGHEVDLSLAELAADQQASTPSNAAELLVPDQSHELLRLKQTRRELSSYVQQHIISMRSRLLAARESGLEWLQQHQRQATQRLRIEKQLVEALNPHTILRRGYAIVRDVHGVIVRTVASAQQAGIVDITLADGSVRTRISKEKP
jgi:exodeoxyribonuclease VII large subunit